MLCVLLLRLQCRVRQFKPCALANRVAASSWDNNAEIRDIGPIGIISSLLLGQLSASGACKRTPTQFVQ